ncbi:hypothetical protein D3C81_1168920 [compost metagenome]
MSAEVSTRVTMITMHIDRIAAMWKVGIPKWNGLGIATSGPSSTLLKSAMPSDQAIRVPMTMASRIDRREMVALPSLLSSSTMAKVSPARPMLATLPNSGEALLPPITQRAATGIRVRPMVVMTIPVTSGGKNLVMRENTGVISKPINEAAMTAPKTPGMPPPLSLLRIAPMVATPANETPCTNGSWQPNHGSPRVCNRVARPPANSDAAINRPMSAGVRPAA